MNMKYLPLIKQYLTFNPEFCHIYKIYIIYIYIYIYIYIFIYMGNSLDKQQCFYKYPVLHTYENIYKLKYKLYLYIYIYYHQI